MMMCHVPGHGMHASKGGSHEQRVSWFNCSERIQDVATWEDHPFGLGSRGPAPMGFLEVSLGRRVVGPRDTPSMAVENVENGFLTTDKSYDDPNPSTG